MAPKANPRADRVHHLNVRLTEAEFNALLRAAVRRTSRTGGRISVGAFMREAALAAAKKEAGGAAA